NRVVEMELLSPDTRPMADAAAGPGEASAAPAAAPPTSPSSPPPQQVTGGAGAGARTQADLPTRDFLREAGRLSRQGDSARLAAAPDTTAATGRDSPGFAAGGEWGAAPAGVVASAAAASSQSG